VTPFKQDGTFDEDATRELIELLIGEGVDGLVMSGSLGEWYALTNEERIRLFEVAADQTRGRITLIAGTSAIRTKDAVELTHAAKDLGCDGAMLLPPPYVLPTEREVFEFFRCIDEVGLPLMLYNNPGRTGINLNARLLSELLVLKNVASLKDSAKDLAQLAKTVATHGNEMAIFTGFESYAVPCIQRGAVGVVGIAPNVLGAKAIDFAHLAIAGDWEATAKLSPLIDQIYGLCYDWTHNPYVVIKEAMRLLGRPGGWSRAPLLPIPDADREELKSALAAMLAG
jgi:4-hydroxy-tetrahydrodipicolinate synthase